MADQFQTIEKKLLAVLNKWPELEFCTIFGSAAAERLTEMSDIDIAVSGNKPLTADEKVALVFALNETLQREIDLIDLQAVSGAILEQALCNAKIVLNKNRTLYAQLLKKLWFDQADMLPYTRRILEKRANQWLQ